MICWVEAFSGTSCCVMDDHIGALVSIGNSKYFQTNISKFYVSKQYFLTLYTELRCGIISRTPIMFGGLPY